MAEMVMHETRGDVNVVIIRPTVIESCYKEPVPGWIQGNRFINSLYIYIYIHIIFFFFQIINQLVLIYVVV